jgi:hypothetical protein
LKRWGRKQTGLLLALKDKRRAPSWRAVKPCSGNCQGGGSPAQEDEGTDSNVQSPFRVWAGTRFA